MKGNDLKGNLFAVLSLFLIFLMPAALHAQNDGTQDSSGTYHGRSDTTRTDSTNIKHDTLGFNQSGNSSFAYNSVKAEAAIQDSTNMNNGNMNGTENNGDTKNSNSGNSRNRNKSNYGTHKTYSDTSGTHNRTDSTGMRKDTLGYIGQAGMYSFAFNGNINDLNISGYQDSSSSNSGMDNNGNSGNSNSGTDNGNTGSSTNGNSGTYNNGTNSGNSSAGDTSGSNNSGSMGNNSNSTNNNSGSMGNNSNSNTNSGSMGTTGNYSSQSGMASQAVSINPVQDLSQQLKENVNLNDDQTKEVRSILRQYEADTYAAKGDREEAQEAASDAQKNIEDVLTDTQKSEWNNTKTNWWASVDKELNLSNLNSTGNNSNNNQ